MQMTYSKPDADSRRRFLGTALTWGTAGLLTSRTTAAAGELRIAMIPYENPQQLAKDVQPVAAFIGKRLGVKVTAAVVLDYAAVVEALRSNRTDVAFMGSLQYLLAKQQCGASAILGEKYQGKPSYTARIFVRKDGGIRTLGDLRNKRMAFVDPISSSGYLYPLAMFRKAGLIATGQKPESFFRRAYFAGGDEQAIRAVLNRFADAAGVGEYSQLLLRPEERDQVTSIAQSEPIPSHCVVVRQGLDPALVKRFQDLLLSLERGPDQRHLKALYNVDGYVRVTPQTYQPVEALAREHGFLR
jgi:phosphonate transport system substrate-binding protein